MRAVWDHMNDYLVRWLMRKYKTLARLGQVNGNAFVHWSLGCVPKAG